MNIGGPSWPIGTESFIILDHMYVAWIDDINMPVVLIDPGADKTYLPVWSIKENLITILALSDTNYDDIFMVGNAPLLLKQLVDTGITVAVDLRITDEGVYEFFEVDPNEPMISEKKE